MKVFKSRAFSKFSRKEKISDERLIGAIKAADSGLIDANYGGGVIKLRIAHRHEGKSGSYRSVILYHQGNSAFFVYGFAKNDQANISPADVLVFKKLAKIMLSMTDEQIDTLLTAGKLEEVQP